MSARDVYEAVLVEMNKEQAPNILLEDFNYFFNKAINQYINKRYNIYDINQQTTDDLRVLKSTAFIPVNDTSVSDLKEINSVYIQGSTTEDGQGDQYSTGGWNGAMKSLNATYRVTLPENYLHMLNCICVYSVDKPWRCYDAGDSFEYPATRLTADLWGQVINNFWIRPTYRRPYYYIHNAPPEFPKNIQEFDGIYSDNLYTNGKAGETPGTGKVVGENSQKEAGKRYGNHSKVYCEIRYGTDKDTFKLKGVYIDYIKVPQFIRLTQKQVDTVQDTSQILEFPDYVCQEIINELVHILMENLEMQRIQTHPVVSQSIANPAQQQTPEQ